MNGPSKTDFASPFMADQYTPFENIKSGLHGGAEGLLDIDGEASAFRYRKQIFVTVGGIDPSNARQIIKGNWKVRLRETPHRSAESGAYDSAILFEQEVRWQANVIAIGSDAFAFISWSPGGPAGGGDQKTTICNGQPCVALDNIFTATPEQLTAYGESGAWRFVDGNGDSDALPNQKFDYERGFVAPETFTPEGNFFSGSVTFSCEWQSAGYLCEDIPIPEGAILETVFDRWQVGALDDEALFRFSYKPGSGAGFDVLRSSRAGITLAFFADAGLLRCARTRRRESLALNSGTSVLVTSQKAKRWKALRSHGGMSARCVVETIDGKIGVCSSFDWGRNWTNIMNFSDGVQMLATCPSSDFGALYVVGKATKPLSTLPAPTTPLPDNETIKEGDLVRMVVSPSKLPDGTSEYVVRARSKLRGSIPAPDTRMGVLSLDGTAFTWSYADKDKHLVLIRSYDECASWQEWSSRT